MEEVKKESLVIYKGQPAIVVEVGKKIDIKLHNGESKKVRDKDILLIHKGPTKSLNFIESDCDLIEIWTLLQGENFSLQELAEYLYGEDTPQAVYYAYCYLDKGLYFSGNIDSLSCNSEEYVKNELDREKLKKEKELLYSQSIERLRIGEWNIDDDKLLREIEALALEERTGSKVLKLIGIKETSIDAHKFLIKIGYWKKEKNPHPGRMGVSLKSTIKNSSYPVVLNPLNLEYLEAYAIDDEGSTDPDDAISLDGDNRIWIHITDVASIIKPGTPEDFDASSKGSNLYLPSEIVHMLPREVTEIQALGSDNGNNALSFMIEFDSEFNIINREVHLTRIKVERLTYNYVELEKDSIKFKRFFEVSRIFRQKRADAGSISISLPEVKIRVENDTIDIHSINGIESRDVVSEFMLLAGETAAIFCSKNNIPIPYATQLPPDAKGKPESDLASMFTWRRKFKRGETKYQAEPHAGLGLNCYTRATSPLRRYSDLVVNQQIRAFLLKEPLMTEDDILIKVAPAVESMRKLTLCERSSNLHWKMIYLGRNIENIFIGTLVEKKDKGLGIFLIEELALETAVPLPKALDVNSKIKLKVKKIDIPSAMVTFISC